VSEALRCPVECGEGGGRRPRVGFGLGAAVRGGGGGGRAAGEAAAPPSS